jgi:hypothetical protein
MARKKKLSLRLKNCKCKIHNTSKKIKEKDEISRDAPGYPAFFISSIRPDIGFYGQISGRIPDAENGRVSGQFEDNASCIHVVTYNFVCKCFFLDSKMLCLKLG